MEGSRSQGNPCGFPLTYFGCGHLGLLSVTMAHERQEPLGPHLALVTSPWYAVLTQGWGGEKAVG